ncbi:S-adenosyl-L-methionine dependent methyltransferase [Fomes fomentarius]|nr:S-adenosyl-L-methionine dependent methyltransferase [Fomes fomentarius]
MEASAWIYSTFFLRLYDFIVLTLANNLGWRCSTGKTLLPFYQKHLGESAHLEIGVGTGFYPAASIRALSKTKLITLVDLNPNTLAFAKERLTKAGYKGKVETVEHNVFTPLPPDMRGKYDSVALYYLFHCLPGAFPKKAADIFRTVIPALAPGGVVYGSTVLAQGVQHTWLGTRMIRLYNKKGVFGNAADSEEGLRGALGEMFEEYELQVVGVVALFHARKPKPVQV